MKGWVKLHRKILESAMYKALNCKQRDVMMQCLLLANHAENEWQWGTEIYKCRAGQFITSIEKLTERCASDVKPQSVRTALLKLEKWGFLTNKSTKTGRLITVCNWEIYQRIIIDANKDKYKESTKYQQVFNKALTTNKNEKNEKNEENEENINYNKNKYNFNTRKFYDNELAQSNQDSKYRNFVFYMYEKNPFNKPLSNVLSLSEQVTFKQFLSILEHQKEYGYDYKEVLLNMENADLKKYISVTLTLRNWGVNDNSKKIQPINFNPKASFRLPMKKS